MHWMNMATQEMDSYKRIQDKSWMLQWQEAGKSWQYQTEIPALLG